jgi:hypothetical protein
MMAGKIPDSSFAASHRKENLLEYQRFVYCVSRIMWITQFCQCSVYSLTFFAILYRVSTPSASDPSISSRFYLSLQSRFPATAALASSIDAAFIAQQKAQVFINIAC